MFFRSSVLRPVAQRLLAGGVGFTAVAQQAPNTAHFSANVLMQLQKEFAQFREANDYVDYTGERLPEKDAWEVFLANNPDLMKRLDLQGIYDFSRPRPRPCPPPPPRP
jgi:hypothetical protein